ncbi:MAG TPA: A24 family peptidase [Solimonas sp.]|jgi:prepilin peptidase CpaA|nr:A24 family peptidase [Solimonas sp.]
MVIVALLVAWATAISWSDWTRRRIPNAALLLMLIPETLALITQGQGLLGEAWLSSVVGMAIGFVLTLPGYLLRRLGAGDVKFAAVASLLLGAPRGFEMVLGGSLLMGVAALVALSRHLPRQTRFPAAPMLAAAFVVEMLAGPLLPVWRR